MKVSSKKSLDWIGRHRLDLVFVLILLSVCLFFILGKDYFGFLGDREAFSEYIRSFGPWGPLAIILFIVLEVIFAPIPGFVPAITSGFLFGPFWGSIYTYIGNMIGSVVVFGISRTLGRQLVYRIFKKRKVDWYFSAIEKRGKWLFALYFIPIFPVDIISGAFGLSSISFRKFFFFIGLGFALHVVILAYIGDFLAQLYF